MRAHHHCEPASTLALPAGAALAALRDSAGPSGVAPLAAAKAGAGPTGYPPLPPLLSEAAAQLVHASPGVLHDLVSRYGSPLHLLWPEQLGNNVHALVRVLQAHRLRFEIFYGAKVNKSLAFVRAAVQAGIGVDVSSLYEAADALRAGAVPSRLCATGPAKTAAFHHMLVQHGALVSIDSAQELHDLEQVLREAPPPAPVRVLLRYRPQASAASRFGMDGHALRACLARLARPLRSMALEGFHFHLGGYDTAPRVQAVRELLPFVQEARQRGLGVRMLDIGGGLPIRYVQASVYQAFLAAQDAEHYRTGKVPASFYPYGGPLDAANWLEQLLSSPCTGDLSVAQALRSNGLTLALEPGRSLVDQTAVSVFRITRVKPLGGTRHVIFVEGSSFSACETWFGSEFLVDPVLVPGDGREAASPPRAEAPAPACEAYIAGHSCLDDDVLTQRWISFAQVPRAGDLLVYANTAGYQMDLLENEFHRHPMPRRIAVTRTAAGGMDFYPDDPRTEQGQT